jgi:hypothetical protein
LTCPEAYVRDTFYGTCTIPVTQQAKGVQDRGIRSEMFHHDRVNVEPEVVDRIGCLRIDPIRLRHVRAVVQAKQ